MILTQKGLKKSTKFMIKCEMLMEIEIKKTNLPVNKIIEISKSPKILVCYDGQNYYAFSGICPHAKWPLELGKISDKILTCAGHGWEYDIVNGKCLSNPGRDLKSYKVIEKVQEIIIFN